MALPFPDMLPSCLSPVRDADETAFIHLVPRAEMTHGT